MTVTINIHGDNAAEALLELKGLSAGLLGTTSSLFGDGLRPLTKEDVEAIEASSLKSAFAPVDTRPIPTTVTPRERGKPAPGRTRRTKEEIAEDEAWADRLRASEDPAHHAIADEALGIQSGGERVDPAEAEQDAADEAAEDAKAEPAMTADDVRNAMGAYVNKFGMDAAQKDGPDLLVEVLGFPPEGNPFWKLSLIPEARYADVVKAWTAAAGAAKRRGA